MQGLVIRPEAARDLREAYDWYEMNSSGRGAKFEAALEKAMRLLRLLPLMGRVIETGDQEVRQIRVKGFPYSVKYAVEDATILILAVWHDKRDPDKWKSRLN